MAKKKMALIRGERIMSDVKDNDAPEGREKVSTTIKRSTIVFIAFAVVILVLALPIMEQTRIHMEIVQNQISDVWVETPRVSLISTIISPAKGTGINTINVTIPQTNQTFQLKDVPDGEYVIIWVTNGKPAIGTYTIEVKLIQNDIIVHTFDLQVSF